jgi:hypothetical protein
VTVSFFNVTLDLFYLGLGLVLLWFPRQWLRYGAFRRSARGARRKDWAPNRERQPGDFSVWLGEEMTKMRNWVDFFRALAGSAAVGGTLIPTTAAIAPAEQDALAAQLALGLKLLVFFVALCLQIFRREERVSLFAPIFYAQGLAFGLIGWKAGLVAVLLAWAANAVLPSAAVLLAVFGFLEILAGLFFRQPRRVTLLAGALTLLPVFVSLVLKRRLAQFTKRTKIIAGPSSTRG